ncbi:nucleoside phosphorylase [Parvicella tangerina]|nr:nucleoside phosphorylase [Parvicella tangerina]
MIRTEVRHSQPIAPSELIITPEGAIYHLNLRPEQIAKNVIVVGDQYRVERISSHFDKVDHKVSKREFVTHTGWYKGKHITALSTGIGCDNVDIVINELDALANIDLNSRLPKDSHTSLNIVRLGTSGALQEDIPVDSFVASTHGLGFDGLMGFYDARFEEDEIELLQSFKQQVDWPADCNPPYIVKASEDLLSRIGNDMYQGITATANGFYGPQGRSLRLKPKVDDLNERLNKFEHNGHRITNFEMETSALYSLSSMLGHHAVTVCAIIANRFAKTYSKDYHIPVDELIVKVLDRI